MILDLIDSPKAEHHEALTRLRAALDTWMVESGDRDGISEVPAVYAPFAKEMAAWVGAPKWFKK